MCKLAAFRGRAKRRHCSERTNHLLNGTGQFTCQQHKDEGARGSGGAWA